MPRNARNKNVGRKSLNQINIGKEPSNKRTRSRSVETAATVSMSAEKRDFSPKPKMAKKSEVRRKIVFKDTAQHLSNDITDFDDQVVKVVETPAKLISKDLNRYQITDPVLHDGVEVDVDPADDDFDLMGPVEKVSDEIEGSAICDDVSQILNNESQKVSDEAMFLKQNPKLEKLFDHYLGEKLKLLPEGAVGTVAARAILTGVHGVQPQPGTSSEGQGQGMENAIGNNNPALSCNNNAVFRQNVVKQVNKTVKSPSDTTIYAPAFARDSPNNINRLTQVQLPQMTENVAFVNDNTIDKITQFVEAVRMEQTDGQEVDEVRSTRPQNDDAANMRAYEEAKKKAEKAILEAEKFKAAISKPPGNTNLVSMGDMNFEKFHTQEPETQSGHRRAPVNYQTPVIGTGLSDDDFFHLTCHVSTGLREKIEKGEFVDLDLLLAKDKFGGFDKSSEVGNPLQWIQNENGTYLVPAKRGNRINSFRRWEQAFRIYATIYCGENPNRSREIWQYISVINTAASTFVWDNVYHYDIIFRQLMEFNPARSWAVTYTQMWNLTMRETLPTRQFSKGNFGYFSQSGAGTSGTADNQGRRSTGKNQTKKIKSDYCWNFNRGITCKYGKRCRYKELCSYCDSPAHGINICPKMEKKEMAAAATHAHVPVPAKAVVPAQPAKSADMI